jgi:hypothetical protein
MKQILSGSLCGPYTPDIEVRGAGCRSSTPRSGELGLDGWGSRAVEKWIFRWNFIYCINAHFTKKDSKWRMGEEKMEIALEIA